MEHLARPADLQYRRYTAGYERRSEEGRLQAGPRAGPDDGGEKEESRSRNRHHLLRYRTDVSQSEGSGEARPGRPTLGGATRGKSSRSGSAGGKAAIE